MVKFLKEVYTFRHVFHGILINVNKPLHFSVQIYTILASSVGLLQSRTFNLCHTALIPVFLSSNVVLKWFFGGIVQVGGHSARGSEERKTIARGLN